VGAAARLQAHQAPWSLGEIRGRPVERLLGDVLGLEMHDQECAGSAAHLARLIAYRRIEVDIAQLNAEDKEVLGPEDCQEAVHAWDSM
jgi:hypothetical protein